MMNSKRFILASDRYSNRQLSARSLPFVAYIDPVLVPPLRPGQIVILDTRRCHRATAARTAIEAAGCTLRFLPTYSPDCNPIELACAKL
jgi:transposase